jgi:hypothetical protein
MFLQPKDFAGRLDHLLPDVRRFFNIEGRFEEMERKISIRKRWPLRLGFSLIFVGYALQATAVLIVKWAP